MLRMTIASALLVVACSGDETARDPGCGDDTDCKDDRICVDGECVSPDGPSSAAATSGAGAGAASSATSGTGGGQGPTVYCTQSSSTACLCGHTADYGLPTTPCNAGGLTSPALCCGNGGWPQAGGCVCTSVACFDYSADTCQCAAITGDENIVGSCSGPVCCRTSGAFGTRSCVCFKQGLSQCPEGDEQVGSCSVADIGCEAPATQLDTCH